MTGGSRGRPAGRAGRAGRGRDGVLPGPGHQGARPAGDGAHLDAVEAIHAETELEVTVSAGILTVSRPASWPPPGVVRCRWRDALLATLIAVHLALVARQKHTRFPGRAAPSATSRSQAVADLRDGLDRVR
ncbi:MAG: hypothetical protein ACRD0K_04795 [Egibacteraceae bacterium]